MRVYLLDYTYATSMVWLPEQDLNNDSTSRHANVGGGQDLKDLRATDDCKEREDSLF